MAERENRWSKRFDIKKGLDIAGVVLGLIAPAALFYAVGYIIIQAYVINVGLNGTFWFNEVFYREAGAKFALDIVTAIVLLPHVFIPLSAALFLFFPTHGAGGWRDHLFDRQSSDPATRPPADRLSEVIPTLSARVRFWIFLTIIAVALGSVVLLIQLAAAEPPSAATAPPVVDQGGEVLSERERLEAVGALESARSAPDIAQRTHRFEKLFSAYWFLPEATRRHFRDAKPLLYPTAILLAIAMPVLVALGGLAYCAFRGGEQGGAGKRPSHALQQHWRRTVGMIWLVATVMLGSYVAVAYGGLFYDFTAVPLIDREKCLPVGKDEPSTRDGTMILQCFLVGRFDRWYILLGWERRKDDSVSQAPIYVKQVEGLEPFSLLTGPGSPVRGILRQLPEFAPENYYAAVPAENAVSSGKPQAAKPQVAGQSSKKAEGGK